MEEMQTGAEVIEQPAAGVQTEETAVIEQSQEVEPQATEQVETPAQDPKEFAFAQRFSHEKQKLERQYEPIVKQYTELEKIAGRYGLTTDQYIAEIQRQEQEAERQALEEQGIDPDYLQQVVSQNPIVQQAQQMIAQQQAKSAFDSEVQELFAENPGLTPEQVPPEVFQLKADRGLSLLDAYLRFTHKASLENAKRAGEQAAIEAVRKNVSPGSLSNPATQETSSVMQMSSDDFKKLQLEVLNGQRKNL
jgi:hypothetical protein